MADPSRRRNSGPIVNSGTLLKQKSPVANDPSVSKDAMVKYLCVCSDFSKLCVDQLLFIDQIEKYGSVVPDLHLGCSFQPSS